jgi:hypothetical protein
MTAKHRLKGLGDFRWEERFEERIRALVPEQVHQAMRQYINPKKLIMDSAGDFTKVDAK